MTAPVRIRLGVAVLVAGIVPTILLTLLVLFELNRTGTLLFDFLLHLLPLGLGVWAALAWSGRHPRGVVLLGAAAGAIEVLTELAVFSSDRLLNSIFGAWVEPAFEDYLAVPATVVLFISGGLLGDRIEARRAAGETGSPGTRIPGTRLTTATGLLTHPAAVPFFTVAGLLMQGISTLA